MNTRSGFRNKDGKQIWSTTVTVVDQERYDTGPFHFGESYSDGSLNEVIESLIAIRDSIPPEYRDKAQCEIDSSGGYEGSHSAHIEVSYERPETPEETMQREQKAAQQAAAQEAKERAAYDALKRKFEPPR